EEFPVRDYGQYRSPQWRDENDKLVPWQSVDWYIYDALNEERMQVDSGRLLHDLSTEPWRDDRLLGDHYDLFVMEEDMYDSGDEERGETSPGYMVGAAKPFSAAVISVHRLEHIWGMPYSCLKTEVMRQVCFMFGVPSKWRDDVEKGRDGQHFCLNEKCILQRVSVAPTDWEEITEIRLEEGALCDFCLSDLRQFFATAEQEVAEI
ncbi:MAG: hypothetical protein KGZ25_08965, partial [Planctomycetes bacterium]|nr:hypothetical protein [Planctomycetota bacterium]